MTVNVVELCAVSPSWPKSFAKMDGLVSLMTTVQPMTLLSDLRVLPELGPAVGAYPACGSTETQ